MSDARTTAVLARTDAKPHLSDAAIKKATDMAGEDTDEARARAMDISLRTYYRMRSGRHDTHLGAAKRVAKRLAMSTDDTFVGGA